MSKLLAILLLFSSTFQGQAVGVYGRGIVQASIPPVNITNSSPLPSGTVSVPYGSVTLTATGGIGAPYTWSCPAVCVFQSGLSVNSVSGNVSGTTSTASTVNVGIKACDAASTPNCFTKTFQLTINSGGAPSGVAITACDPTKTPEANSGAGSKLTSSGGTYYVANNIAASGTCVLIANNNITLNVHGNDISYANSVQSVPTFGVVGIGCGEADATAGACDGAGVPFQNPTIYSDVPGSGSITQGTGAAGLSDGIRIGGNSGGGACGGGAIHDISINISRPTGTTNPNQKASRSINFRYCQANVTLGPNITTNNTESWVQNRTGIEGPDIRAGENWSGNGGALTVIGPNNIGGSGQGGIYHGESWSTSISNSTIGGNGHVVQDFGLFAWGTNDDIHDNTVNCLSCRGIFVGGHDFHTPAATGQHVYNNNVTFTMVPQYCPDGSPCPTTAAWGCEPHGAYGIQYDDGPQNAVIDHNTVDGTVKNGTNGAGGTESCQAIGLKITTIDTGDVSHDNVFRVRRLTSGVTARAIGYGTESNTATVGFFSTDDTFEADSANFFGDWLGAIQPHTFLRTIIKGGATGGNLDPNYKTFLFGNGNGDNCGSPSHCPLHWILIDPTFQGSATKDSNNMGSYGGAIGPSEYFIKRTYLPTILCAPASTNCTPGNAVPAATVAITELGGGSVFSGATDAGGHIASGLGTVLTEFRRSNCTTFDGTGTTCTSGGSVFKEMHTPHNINVSKAGCTTLSYSLDLTTVTNGSVSENRNISCP